MEFFLQDTSFLLLILAIIALVGVLIGWSLRASLSERPILEAYERLEQDRNSLARLFAQTKDQLELRTNEVRNLNQEITALKQELSVFEVEKAVRHSVNEVYAARLGKVESDAAHYSEKIVFLESQSDQLSTRNGQLLLDIERLREELKAWMTLHRDFAGLQQQVQELASANTVLEQERTGYRQQVEMARIEIENLQQSLLRSTTVTGHPLGTVASSVDDRLKATPTHPAEVHANADDLKLINGVTPFAEQQMFAQGIRTFEQIGSWDDAAIQKIAGAVGCTPEKIREEDWPAQARHLVKMRNKNKRV